MTNWPKSMTTIASGSRSAMAATASGALTFPQGVGSRPTRRAASATGVWRACPPRPAGRGGWVTTAATSWPAWPIASNEGIAKSPLPMNTIRIPAIVAVDGTATRENAAVAHAVRTAEAVA